MIASFVGCASTVPLTTELQARSSDKIKIQKASNFFGLKTKQFNPIQYQIYDSNGVLAANNIIARYRDKGKSVDFTLKLRFAYDENMIDLLSRCFIDQKLEINRYSDRPNPTVELSFQNTYRKEDMGLEKSTALTQQQILEKFSELQREIKIEISLLLKENPEFTEYLEDMTDATKKNFEMINQRMKVISDTNVGAWKNTSTYQRDRWFIGAWESYPEVVIEVTRSEKPSMEISTRLEGNVKDRGFFRDLRHFGLDI